jgi:type I restriction enzyme, S subunit
MAADAAGRGGMMGGKLKPGWKVRRFDQIATNVNVRIDNPSESGMEHYIGLEHLDPDSLRIRRWGSPNDVEATKLVFKKGDIIFGRRRAYQRKLGVAEFDGICSAHAMVLRAKPEVVLPEFLPFFMQSDLFMSRAVEISVGSLSPTINWKTMAVQEFALPPMEEQRRIVELAAAHHECVSSHRELADSLASLLLSRTQVIFGIVNKGTSVMRKVGDIGEVQYGLTVNAKRRTADWQLPYLRVANVQRFCIDLSEVKEIGIENKDAGCLLQRDDILVVEGHADINELGRAAIWEEQMPVCHHQNHLIRIRCHEDVVPYYVLEYVNSPVARAYFRQQGKSTSGLNTLNSKVVREMPIPIPDRNEQESIASELREGRLGLGAAKNRLQRALTLAKIANEQALGGGNGQL